MRRILDGIILLAIIIALTSAAYLAVKSAMTQEPHVEEVVEVTPPTLGPFSVEQVPVMWAIESIAHGCPISEDVALTAGHVTWFPNRYTGEQHVSKPLVWSDGFGHSGVVSEKGYSVVRDVATVKVVEGDKFFYTFHLSETEPEIGEKLYAAVYDYDKNLNRKWAEVTLVRAVASAYIVTPATGSGSSGGCVFRKDGTVVGVLSAQFDSQTGIVESVIGKWEVKG